MQIEERLRADIVEIGRRLHDRGFVASNDGNISVRLDAERLLTTPTGVSKGSMTPDMMVTTDFSGRKRTGEREPSSEILMHLAVYEHRPEIEAVVHAHPPTATGFSVAGIPLDRAVLAEVVTTLGSIPIADYGTPSTSELADAVRHYIRAHDGLLLANHGALTVRRAARRLGRRARRERTLAVRCSRRRRSQGRGWSRRRRSGPVVPRRGTITSDC